TRRGNACAEYRRNVILAGYDGTVTQRPAHIGDHPCGQREERRPGRSCDPCYQDITPSHLAEFKRASNYPRRARHPTRGGPDSLDHFTCWLVTLGWYPSPPFHSQNAISPFAWQGDWRRE